MLGLVIFSIPGFTQKIKYKDLYPQLEAKNYKSAEPTLRVFLNDEKNADEANAHYQFAVLMDMYFMEGDVILDTTNTFAKGDTAIAFYRLAKNLITEKELKKNDEYYQSFYRRDLRTGKFGIKLSDVHLDIEKKIESIENRITLSRNLHLLLASVKETESSLVSVYNSLVNSYTGYIDFVMGAGPDEITNLGTLSDFQFTIIDKSKEIKDLANQLGITDKYQSLEFVDLPAQFEIVDEIMTTLDGSLEVYAFDDWVSATKIEITGDVNYLKRMFENNDQVLAEAKSALLESDNRTQFPSEVPEDLVRLSEKYDPDNGPLDLIKARISENVIINLSDTVINPNWNDSLLIAYHAETSDSIAFHLQVLNEVLPTLKEKLTQGEKYYGGFYNRRFGELSDAHIYVDELSAWTESQNAKWDTIGAYWNLMNNWGITEKDTIPLNPVDTTYRGNYFTMGNWSTGDYDIVPYGVKTDSLIGFVARFGADRKVIWEDRFESTLFEGTIDQRFEMDTLLLTDEEVTFYFFDPVSTGRHNMTIVSLNFNEKVNWSVSVNAENKPVYNTYSEGIGQHTIFFHPQEAYPLADGRLGYIVIDRNGEVR